MFYQNKANQEGGQSGDIFVFTAIQSIAKFSENEHWKKWELWYNIQTFILLPIKTIINIIKIRNLNVTYAIKVE